MTCDVMLERMLDAEPSELEGKGGTILARHVRECDQCAVVARQLRADETALAAASAKYPRRATVRATDFAAHARYPRYVTPASIGTALMAASALFLLLRTGDVRELDLSAPPLAKPEVPEVVGTGPLPEGNRRSGGSGIVQSSVPTDTRVRAESPPVRLRRLAGATAVVASAVPAIDVRVTGLAGTDNVARAALTAGYADVVVDPPPGVRATVMRGSAPGVTVVWLH